MTLLNKNLYSMWNSISNWMGWIRLVEKDLNKQDIETLEQIDNEVQMITKEAEKDYYENELPKIREQDAEFVKEIKSEFGNELKQQRIESIKDEIKFFHLRLKQILKNFQESSEKGRPLFLRRAVIELNNPDKIHKKIQSLLWEKYLTEYPDYRSKNWVEKHEIERAIQADWTKILKFNKKGFALCPFHQESKASFHVNKKNNYGHCFGCEWHGNIINFLMDRDTIKFNDAVRILLKS
jgi:hypothetical protein